MRSESDIHRLQPVFGFTASPTRAVRRAFSSIPSIAVAMMLHVAPASAQSARTYVSGTGNDGNSCALARPCRTLQAALKLTKPGGEIQSLDSADYGHVTINQAVSILGAHGATGVLAANVSGVTINAGANDVVTLKGLEIDGSGTGTNGVQFSSGAALNVQDSEIRGFATGISFTPKAASSVSVSNTVLSNNTTGFLFQASTASTGVLSEVHLVNNASGAVVQGTSSANATLTVQNGVVANNGNVGLLSNGYSVVNVSGTTIANNGTGVQAQGASALLQLAGATVTGNRSGWIAASGGQVSSSTVNNSIGGNMAANAAPPSSQPVPPAPPSTTVVTKNIVADFGATCNGSGDDNGAFTAFNTWARKWQASNPGLIELQIPHGAVCMFNRAGLGNAFADGIKQLRVVGLGYAGQGDGATFSDANGQGNGFFLGAYRSMYQDNQHSARLATVSAGSSCVTLLNAAQANLFTAGSYALISGIDMMGYGFPANPYFYEFPKVAAVDTAHGCGGTAGASVTFTAPLQNGYKSTWPLYNAGNDFEADQGGPATLYALGPAWDTAVEYRGITFASNGGQTYANGRDITYTNVKFTGTFCAVPSQNMNWTAVNSDFSNCAMEVDKIIGTVTLNGVTIRQIQFQSSSVNVFNLINSTVTETINGTPKKFVGSGSTIANLGPGAYAYGRTDEVTCSNCNIGAIAPMGVLDKGGLDNVGFNNLYTMSNGVIVSSNSNGPPTWYVPGTHLYWAGRFGPQSPHCQIIDVTQDASNTYIQTTCSGGFPNIPLGGSPLGLRVHPAPKFTCSNCTGSQFATILSSAPAGAPLGSYFKATLNSNNPSVPAWLFGTIKTVNFNVTAPYQGSGAPNVNLDGPFVLSPDGTTSSIWVPTVNSTLAGLRTVTATAVAGAQPGDSLPIPGSAWFIPGQITANFSATVTSNPVSATIEIITDQGIQ